MITKSQCREWIDALRSGKYKQGRTELHGVIDGEDRYCCLGVARELRLGRKAQGDEYLHNTFLPRETQTDLAEKNDCGKSFKQIARDIERNILPTLPES